MPEWDTWGELVLAILRTSWPRTSRARVGPRGSELDQSYMNFVWKRLWLIDKSDEHLA